MKRFRELDALRGIAALVVVLFHYTLFYPIKPPLLSLVASPLTAGHESVTLFFVLSGLVLTLPFLSDKSLPYNVYLQRRALRIYGPYLGALVLSVIGCAVWNHYSKFSPAPASHMWTYAVTRNSIIQHVLFLGNYPSHYNMTFWSLVYEMRISIIFPLLYLIARKAKTVATLVLTLGCLATGLKASIPTIEYAGFFLMGILIANNLETIAIWFKSRAGWARSAFAGLAFLLYEEGHHMDQMADPLIAMGAAGLLIVVMNSTTIRTALNTPIPIFLGRISYSLYLIHSLVLLPLLAVLKGRVPAPLFLLVYVSLAVLASWGFYAAVEAPFMRLSRAVKAPSDEKETHSSEEVGLGYIR